MGCWTQGVAISCAALLCVCCESTNQPARSAALSLPPYAGHEAELFDDAIEAAAIPSAGADESLTSEGATLLRERTRTGDAVVRARVVTVTSNAEGDGESWQIALHTLEALAGKRLPDKDFSF